MKGVAEDRASLTCQTESARTTSLPVLMLALLALGVPLSGKQQQPSASADTNTAGRLDQGCVNQGADRRVGAPVVCWAQRHLSWKSEHEPAFVLIGSQQRTSVGLAWPPYLVYNSPDRSGRWRIGVRDDRMWRGYIFPTAAFKRVSNPLRY